MTSHMSRLGVGILGLHEGRTLIVALNHEVPKTVGPGTTGQHRAPNARVVAACDLKPEKLEAARQNDPSIALTDSYDEMLANDAVDIVAIYTPDHLHGEHIVRAFEAGKDVICTKPLVNSLDDARRVLEASRRTGGKLLVGQSSRFFEPFQRQRAGYEQGALGDLELVDAHYIHRMDWYYDKSPWAADATDWIFLGMSHAIDLVRWYLGPVARVHAFGSRSALAQRHAVKSFDIITAHYEGVTGRTGRAMAHFGLHELPSARNAVELMLYGEAGTSQAQYHDMRYRHTAPDGAEVTEDMLYERRAYYFNNETHGMHYGEFANYTQYFAEALLEGRAYSPDLEEGLETVCIMEATRQSAQTGQPVEVEPLLAEIGLA